MAKHNRASNLGKFLHPKKSGSRKPAPTKMAGPISVGAFDSGPGKNSLPKKIK